MKPAPEAHLLPATEADLPAIAELADVIWRAVYPGIVSTEQIEFMLARMYAPDTLRDDVRLRGIPFYRLVVAGRLAGFAALGPTEAAAVWKLHKLYLEPELHGRRLGSQLLQHCESEARRLGARRLILAVNKRNARALKAYRRNGFTIAESVTAAIGGGFVMDDFIMAKDFKQDELE